MRTVWLGISDFLIRKLSSRGKTDRLMKYTGVNGQNWANNGPKSVCCDERKTCVTVTLEFVLNQTLSYWVSIVALANCEIEMYKVKFSGKKTESSHKYLPNFVM